MIDLITATFQFRFRTCRESSKIITENRICRTLSMSSDDSIVSSDCIHMASIRDHMKDLANHWRLTSFREGSKRVSSIPKSKSMNCDNISDIFAIINLYETPQKFYCSTNESQRWQTSTQTQFKITDIGALISTLNKEYDQMMRHVDEQMQIEKNLFTIKPNAYSVHRSCGSTCIGSATIPVYYKESVLVPSDRQARLHAIKMIYERIISENNQPLTVCLFDLLYSLM